MKTVSGARGKVGRVGLLGVILLGTGAAACDDGAKYPAPATYFAPTTPYTNPTCNTVDRSLAGEREMRLFSSGSVNVTGLSQGLSRYYSRHALTFFTQASEQPAGTAYALDTSEAALGSALAKAFPNDDLNNEAALMADPVKWNAIVTFVTNFMLRPMIDFARVHGDVGQGATNLVVVPDLERPGGQKLGDANATLVGIAICPALLKEFAASMNMDGEIWKGVTLPPNFTPMMFLGYNALQKATVRDQVLKDLTVAHEFGHASGLPHSDVMTNLMYPSAEPGRSSCTDDLDEAQLAVMRTNLGVGDAAAASGALTGADFARPGARTQPARRFTPADLRAVLAGDGRAMRRLLGPLVHDAP